MKGSKKKQSRAGSYAIVLLWLVLGVCMGMTVVNKAEILGEALEKRFLFYGAFFIGLYVSSLLHIAIHEAGHLVFGLATGYRFVSYRVGNLILLREGDKLRIRRFSLAGTGGQCLMAPPTWREDGKLPVVLYNLGGSLMNLIASGLLLPVYLLCQGNPWVSILLQTFIWFGVISALANGIPLRAGLVDNDGKNAQSLRRDPKALRAFWVQLAISEQNAKGVRLGQMPEEWFAVPDEATMQNPLCATVGVFACNRLMDQARLGEADDLMKQFLEMESDMIDLHRRILVCDRIFCALLRGEDKPVWTAMLDSKQKGFMRAMKGNPSVIRTEYAMALLGEGNSSKASKLSAQFEKVASTYPYPHEIEGERELIKLVDEKATRGTGSLV